MFQGGLRARRGWKRWEDAFGMLRSFLHFFLFRDCGNDFVYINEDKIPPPRSSYVYTREGISIRYRSPGVHRRRELDCAPAEKMRVSGGGGCVTVTLVGGEVRGQRQRWEAGGMG